MAVVDEKMEKELARGLDELSAMDVDSEDYQKAAATINQLLKTRNDGLKLQNEKIINESRLNAEIANRTKETELKESQGKREERKIWIELGCTGAGLLAWILMNFKVMHFEQTGVIRSKAFQGTLPKIANFLKIK